MEAKAASQWLAEDGPSFYREQFVERFDTPRFFTTHDSHYYVLQGKGEAVYTYRANRDELKLDRVGVEEQEQKQRAVHTIDFRHPVTFDVSDIAELGVGKLNARLRDAGREFAAELDGIFMNLVIAAAGQNYALESSEIHSGIATVIDELARNGHHADVILVPYHYQARLKQMGVVVADSALEGGAYLGTVNGQLKAFSFADACCDGMYVFDSSVARLLVDRESFYFMDKAGLFRSGVQGYLELAGVVENTDAVVSISGLEDRLKQLDRGVIVSPPVGVAYVDPDRIEELREASSPGFDTSRLVELCREINICYSEGCYLATLALVRTILYHVPPIFGYSSFKELASQAAGGFGKSMRRLEGAVDLAGRHLHQPIRKKESLPSQTQSDFHNELDALLEEVVRLLK